MREFDDLSRPLPNRSRARDAVETKLK